jgi:hypothetical protein
VPRGKGKHEPEYDDDLGALDEQVQKEIALLEDQILSDPDREYQREYGPDGVFYDFSEYDRLGVTIAYERDGYDFTFLRLTDQRGSGR